MPRFDPEDFASISVPADKPRAAARHGKIKQVADDIYMVRGRMPSAPGRPLLERLLLHYSRTMTIIRRPDGNDGYELTLVNTIRLNEKRLRDLAKLGRVRHVVRLGSFHGVDDAFYVHEFGANYWVVDGMNEAPGATAARDILANHHLPVPEASLFSFEGLRFPEAILILPPTAERAGVAISTDSIQNHTSAIDIDNSPLVSLAIWRIGLAGRARLGPVWLRDQVPMNKNAGDMAPATRKRNMIDFFRPQFERLLATHEFDMLMPGHGWPLMRGAREAIRISMDDQL